MLSAVFRRRAPALLVWAALAITASPLFAQPVSVQRIEWLRQLSTPAFEGAGALWASGTAVYAGGLTWGDLFQPNAGSHDAILMKFDPAGTLIWARQFGGPGPDSIGAIVGWASVIYAVGTMGNGSQGLFDTELFVGAYDAAGNELWTRQFGSADGDSGLDIAADETGLYVVGRTSGELFAVSLGLSDAYLAKLDFDGNVLWTRQFGAQYFDDATGVAVDATGVYVGGATCKTAAHDSCQVFARKYTMAGGLIWAREFGTDANERAAEIAVGGAGVYLAGVTRGTLESPSHGGYDAFVSLIDRTAGQLVSVRQFGTEGDDSASAVAVSSGVFVGGSFAHPIPDDPYAGDAYVRTFSSTLGAIGTFQLPAGRRNQVAAIAVSGEAIYASGTYGDPDVFVARLGLLPDTDGDGIVDSIDTVPLSYSNAFARTRTFGSIVSRGGQILSVTEGPRTSTEVRITADPAGSPDPSQQAILVACAFLQIRAIGPGDRLLLDCRSVDAEVEQGTVELEFLDANGSVLATATLVEGNSLTFDPGTMIFTAPACNENPILVLINGTPLVVNPGGAAGIVSIDVKPGDPANVVQRRSNGVVPVALLSTGMFDALSVDPASGRFGPGEAVEAHGRAHPEDVDGDGDVDLVLHFRTADARFVSTDTVACLSGKTLSGSLIIGCDAVRARP